MNDEGNLYLMAAAHVGSLGIDEKLFALSMQPPYKILLWVTFHFLAFCDLPITFQLTCRRNSEEAVSSGVVDQRAGEQEPREEPAKGVAFLLKEHQHPIHGLDAKGVVPWRR